MKSSLLRILTLTLLTVGLTGQLLAADAPADSKADKDWQVYTNALNFSPPADKDLSPKEMEEFGEQYCLKTRELGLAFIEKYPTDPRRWKAVLNFDAEVPRFIKQWGPLDANGSPTNNIVDTAAVEAWKKKLEELRADMAKATDLTPELRAGLAYEEANKPFAAAAEAQEKGQPADLPALRAKLMGFASQYPEAKQGAYLYYTFMFLVESRGLTNLEAECKLLANCPNKEIAKEAKAKLAFCELVKKPLDITFTAVDGRAVDLKKLRGKVVLVDFWATWCGPCVEELPNVKKAYDAFHDKGFEVVGISLEMIESDKKDTPEQEAAKLAAAKKKLTNFTAKRNMTWPQYFDGKGWKNEISSKYALSGIPAMFLLDQDGRLVTTNARGEALAKEVKRLLKL